MWWIDGTSGQIRQAASSPGGGWLGPYPTQAAAKAALSGQGPGSGGDWWVVTLIAANPPGQQSDHVVQSATRPPATAAYAATFGLYTGVAGVKGPYKTQAEAQGNVGPLTHNDITSLPNPLGAVSAFLGHVADGRMWASVGWIALGVALMILGVYIWLRTSGGYKALENTVTKALPVKV